MRYAKLIVISIVGLIVYFMWLHMHLFFQSQPRDFPNEPTGFAGMEWGTPFAKVRNEMEVLHDEAKMETAEAFHRKGWPKRFESLNVSETIYRFSWDYRRSLSEVWVRFPIENFEEVAEYCLKLWGKVPKKELLTKPYYEWRGTSTTIQLEYDVLYPEKFGVIQFYSTEYKLQQERERNRKK